MQVVPVLGALTFGLAGVVAFHLLALPLPWLLGPITSCLLAALLGVPLGGIKPVNAAMRTVLGVAVGATLTPAVLATFPSMWPTLILMPVFILAIGVAGVPYFRRLCGYDFPTAYFAAMPGGLQDMVVFGEEAGGNVRALSLVHATRVLVIAVALPFLLKGIWDADLDRPPGVPLTTIAPSELALMVLAAGFGWWAARKVGLFGATILGPMILAAAVTLAGFLEQRPPAEAIWAAQFFIGMTIGSNYNGITVKEIRKDILAGLGFCGLLIILTLVFVEAIYSFGLAPGMSALLAYSPGGQAELTVLALVVGADMAFVVAHHILRLVIVIMGAPLAARLLDRGRG
ncbi:MAG: AbrB family transcriptional regulator [Boseongicola sp.]|nr:AbrB family transcriptional regulator [Boseongicola sp.]MYH59132.1 AbrB family transcriptional regulator [Boseongicola sp. SB0675_bin_26]